jgi:hypothetical protein
VIILFVAEDIDGKIAMNPQNAPKQFRNLNTLAVIKKCL